MELLACVLNVLVSHAPKLPQALQPHDEAVVVDTLKAISEGLKTDTNRVRTLMTSVDVLCGQMLANFCSAWRSSDKKHPVSSMVTCAGMRVLIHSKKPCNYDGNILHY